MLGALVTNNKVHFCSDYNTIKQLNKSLDDRNKVVDNQDLLRKGRLVRLFNIGMTSQDAYPLIGEGIYDINFRRQILSIVIIELNNNDHKR